MGVIPVFLPSLSGLGQPALAGLGLALAICAAQFLYRFFTVRMEFRRLKARGIVGCPLKLPNAKCIADIEAVANHASLLFARPPPDCRPDDEVKAAGPPLELHPPVHRRGLEGLLPRLHHLPGPDIC